MENTVSVKITLDGFDYVTAEVPLNEKAGILSGLTLSVKGLNLNSDEEAKADTDYDCAFSPPFLVPKATE